MARFSDIWLIHPINPGGADRVDMMDIALDLEQNDSFGGAQKTRLRGIAEMLWQLPRGELDAYRLIETTRSDADTREFILLAPGDRLDESETLISPRKVTVQ